MVYNNIKNNNITLGKSSLLNILKRAFKLTAYKFTSCTVNYCNGWTNLPTVCMQNYTH